MQLHQVIRDVIESVFTTALFTNALLFVPQTIKIFKEKDGGEISLITFGGFLLIQFTILLHGVIENDILLIIGYSCSMLACGSVVSAAIFFRNKYKKSSHDITDTPKYNQEKYVEDLKSQIFNLETEIKLLKEVRN